MNNRYEALKAQAIADCKAGRYIEAERALEQLLEVMKRFGSPLANSPTMYWYLVARNKGDEKKAMDEFMTLPDQVVFGEAAAEHSHSPTHSTRGRGLVTNDWADLVRQYLAFRKPALLEQAIMEAKRVGEQDVVELLGAFQQDGDSTVGSIAACLQVVESLVAPLAQFLQGAGRAEEAYTVALLPVDLRTRLAEASNQFPVEMQQQAWQIGQEACEDAISISAQLGDLPCIAFYQSVKGNGLYLAHNFIAARGSYEEALKIRRQLVIREPQVHEPYLARTLNNLGNVQVESMELESAREWYEEALIIYRRLILEQPHKYEPDLATTLSNLGVVLDKLREPIPARARFEEALGIYRRLAQPYPSVHEVSLAMALHNFGTMLNGMGEREPAQEKLNEASVIYRRLADDRPEMFLPDLAMSLNGLGVMLYESKKLEKAKEKLEEAKGILRTLALNQPPVYEPGLATTLNNLGNLLNDFGSSETAREHYQEAIVFRERHQLYLDSAGTHYNWGRLEEEEGNAERAQELFEMCVERCERGLNQLKEREHRDLFKGKMEPAYLRLIDHYARLAESDRQATQERLVGLMESLRQVEALAGFGEAVSDEIAAWREAFHHLINGTGELSDLFREKSCAFLWMHAARNSVVFAILTPGKCQVKVVERAVLDKFWELFGKVEEAMAAFQSRNPMLLEAISLTRKGVAGRILDTVPGEVFDLLPSEVKALFEGDSYKTIFLAPCSETINLPFEMLRVPGGRSSDSPFDDSYLGLRLLMPRVHGLAELVRVLKRQPELNGGRKALVVGNPLHHGFPHLGQPCRVCDKGLCLVCGEEEHCGTHPLRGAREMAVELARVVRQKGFTLLPNNDALLDEGATAAAVLTALAAEGLCFWAQNGHGGRPSVDGAEGAEYLALAGRDRLLPLQVARLHLPGTVVHHDCCVVGTTRGRGGGRFDGHPTAALLAGASCVLSSVHALWDDTAAGFSARLYDKVLHAKTPSLLGDALLETRREMAKAHHDNPLVWATTVLWGNPWARLQMTMTY